MNRNHLPLLAALCAILMSWTASAQPFVRYIKPEDIGTKTLYADSVLTSITLPRGVSRLDNYPKFNFAAMELYQVLQDPDKEILQVWVCGSASPDGLWGDNVRLSQARTDAAVEYLKCIIDIPDWKIHKESLNEDWDRLAELVEKSDTPYKWEILHIIRTKEWGERKTALQKLDGGRVWKILEKDFFPKLRCVRFAIYCKWDPTKPYLTAPEEVLTMVPEKTPEKVTVEVAPEVPAEVPAAKPDTVYVRDTVFMMHETVYVAKDQPVTQVKAYDAYRERSLRQRKVWDTPWMMGVKTNLLADCMVIPMGGLEVQIGKRLSLDLQGWYTNYNAFCKADRNANVYGFTPELRLWTGNRAMERGSFFGIHARTAWYTMQWTDGLLYQNGAENQYALDAGSNTPAWSIGLTYGYSFALDRKAHWGLELLLGIGYGNYSQNLGAWNEKDMKWYIHEHQDRTHIGITRAGINLTYRFSVRKVDPAYYEHDNIQ